MSAVAAAAAALVEACRAAGTTHAFGVPGGGSNLDVVGAIHAAGLRFVLTHTETAAALMAAVAGERTGAPGLCLATRGPGAASLVNGVANAMLDRQALVVVTDRVSEADAARVSHQRIDQAALFAPVTKASFVLRDGDPAAAAAVVATALADRPGPVHVELDPGAACAPSAAAAAAAGAADLGAGAADLRAPTALHEPARHEPALRELLASARRPVVIVGVGAVLGGAARRSAIADALAALGHRSGVPMLCTYRARGMVADGAPTCAGVATGATAESPLLHEADLIVGVGLDPVELIPSPWPYEAPVVTIGTWPVDDSTFFGEKLHTELIVTDLAAAVTELAPLLHTSWPPGAGATARLRALAEIEAAVPSDPSALTPQEVVQRAALLAPAGCVITVDAGAHMFLATTLWPVDRPGQLLISSGLATMGFALPAAIAAAATDPGRPVVCLTGDGGLGMVLAELETLARLGLPVVVVVFDDASLSLIAAKQKPTGQGGRDAVAYRSVDFATIATACGVTGMRVTTVAEYDAALRMAFARGGPALLDVAVDPSAYGRVLDAVRGQRHHASDSRP